jgi:hypothetical protein
MRVARSRLGDTGSNRFRTVVLLLGHGSFEMGGGKVATLHVRLTAAALKLLSASRLIHAQTTIVAHDPQGTGDRSRFTVTIRAAGG